MLREQGNLALFGVSFYVVLRLIMGGGLCDLISGNFKTGVQKAFWLEIKVLSLEFVMLNRSV